MKKKIREWIVGGSVVVAFLAYVASVSSIGLQDFGRRDLLLIIIATVSLGWLGLFAYANKK